MNRKFSGKQPRLWLTLIAVVFVGAAPAAACDLTVEKKEFSLPKFKTQQGAVIEDVRVGWESYGELNAAKDNVILIAHYFSGNSHAAGCYSEDDAAPGYWDAIIGPGKAVDTDRYFVLSVDSLANLGVNDPNVITTGPATVNPETGEPYGMAFPIVTIRDFVEVQKALLESLGVKKLHAVMGASMGSLQAYEWASVYPDKVERLIPVIGAGQAHGDLIGWLNIWGSPIRLDPNWNGGDYYDGEPPVAGLAQALKIVTLHANHWEWANESFGRRWAAPDADPAAAHDNLFVIEATLDSLSTARAAQSDANHFLYLAKASQLYFAGGEGETRRGLLRIEAPTLVIFQEEDLIFPGEVVRETAAIISADGTPVELFELTGKNGHLDGLLSIGQAGDAISAFLTD